MDSATPPDFLAVPSVVAQSHDQSHNSLEDADPTWKTQFQLMVTEGGPPQLVSALHLLPKLYRVIVTFHFPLHFLNILLTFILHIL